MAPVLIQAGCDDTFYITTRLNKDTHQRLCLDHVTAILATHERWTRTHQRLFLDLNPYRRIPSSWRLTNADYSIIPTELKDVYQPNPRRNRKRQIVHDTMSSAHLTTWKFQSYDGASTYCQLLCQFSKSHGQWRQMYWNRNRPCYPIRTTSPAWVVIVARNRCYRAGNTIQHRKHGKNYNFQTE